MCIFIYIYIKEIKCKNVQILGKNIYFLQVESKYFFTKFCRKYIFLHKISFIFHFKAFCQANRAITKCDNFNFK